MTAEPYGDPEATAGSAAVGAYTRVLVRRVLLAMALLAGFLAVTACDYTFGVLALRRLPVPAAAVLAVFMAAEAATLAVAVLRMRRARAAAPAATAAGDKMTAALDKAQLARSRPVAPPWWQASRRGLRFWRGLAVRSVYSSCLGLVLAGWAGGRIGVFAAVCYTAIAMAFTQSAVPVMSGALNAAAFIDPRPPRDTPEI